VLSLLVVTPASASVSSPYAVDDADNVPFAKGNIVSMSVRVAPAKVIWIITLRRGVNLDTSDEWDKYSLSSILIPMDTRGGGAIDWRVEVYPSSSGALGGVVESGPGGTECPLQIDQPDTLRTIRLRMSRACIGNPAMLRGRVTYAFDKDGDETVDSTDRSPDGGFTPQVEGPPFSAG
jgi:hypothetical protein